MASSLVAKSRTMLERGSAVLAQPIRLFSHLCWLSNSIFHLKERQLRRSKSLGHPLSAQKGSHIIASRNSQFACYHSPVRRKNTFWFQPCLTAWGSWLAWRSSPENTQLMTEAKFHFHYSWICHRKPIDLSLLSFSIRHARGDCHIGGSIHLDTVPGERVSNLRWFLSLYCFYLN